MNLANRLATSEPLAGLLTGNGIKDFLNGKVLVPVLIFLGIICMSLGHKKKWHAMFGLLISIAIGLAVHSSK